MPQCAHTCDHLTPVITLKQQLLIRQLVLCHGESEKQDLLQGQGGDLQFISSRLHSADHRARKGGFASLHQRGPDRSHVRLTRTHRCGGRLKINPSSGASVTSVSSGEQNKMQLRLQNENKNKIKHTTHSVLRVPPSVSLQGAPEPDCHNATAHLQCDWWRGGGGRGRERRECIGRGGLINLAGEVR